MSRLVRRWGARTVSLVATAFGLYIVAPGLLALFGSFPRLRDVEPWWFVVLIALVGGSMASMWWLTRLALLHRDERGRGPHHGRLGHRSDRAPGRERRRQDRPRRPGHGGRRPGQGPHRRRRAPRCGGVGHDGDGAAHHRRAPAAPDPHRAGAADRAPAGPAAGARARRVAGRGSGDRGARRADPALDALREGRRSAGRTPDPDGQAGHHRRHGLTRAGQRPRPGRDRRSRDAGRGP